MTRPHRRAGLPSPASLVAEARRIGDALAIADEAWVAAAPRTTADYIEACRRAAVMHARIAVTIVERGGRATEAYADGAARVRHLGVTASSTAGLGPALRVWVAKAHALADEAER